MSDSLSPAALEKLCRPLAKTMSDELARALAELQADEETQQRYNELADRNTAGELFSAEQAELAALVRANTVLGVLKAEALLHLNQRAAA